MELRRRWISSDTADALPGAVMLPGAVIERNPMAEESIGVASVENATKLAAEPSGADQEMLLNIAANDEPVASAGTSGFRFNGPSSLFLSNYVLASLFSIAAIWINKNAPTGWDANFKIGLSLAATALAGILLLPLHWLSVAADDSKLRIRKRWLGTINEIPIPDIKKIKIYTETGQPGCKTQYLGINLRSGKALDFFLPKAKQLELLDFVSQRLGRRLNPR